MLKKSFQEIYLAIDKVTLQMVLKGDRNRQNDTIKLVTLRCLHCCTHFICIVVIIMHKHSFKSVILVSRKFLHGIYKNNLDFLSYKYWWHEMPCVICPVLCRNTEVYHLCNPVISAQINFAKLCVLKNLLLCLVYNYKKILEYTQTSV